jgi:hypothetical protein
LSDPRSNTYAGGQEQVLLSAKTYQSPYAHPVWQILILSIAPAIGLGICRFAYPLVLPDMPTASAGRIR